PIPSTNRSQAERKARARGETRGAQVTRDSTFGLDREHCDRRVSPVSLFPSLCNGKQRSGKRASVPVIARRTGTRLSVYVASLNRTDSRHEWRMELLHA